MTTCTYFEGGKYVLLYCYQKRFVAAVLKSANCNGNYVCRLKRKKRQRSSYDPELKGLYCPSYQWYTIQR